MVSGDPLRAYLQHLPAAVFLYRRTGDDFELIDVNPAGWQFAEEIAARSLGRRASEILNHRPVLLEDLHRCWREQCSVRRTLNLRFGGQLRTTYLTYVPGQPDLVVVLVEDVTATEVAHAALARSEEKYRTLVEGSAQGITIYQDDRIVFVNGAAAQLARRTAEELLAMRPEELPLLVHPDDRPMVTEAMRNRREGRPAPARSQYRLLAPDGAERWIESVVTPVQFEGRAAWMSLAMDITEQRRVEAALRASEERHRAIVETGPQCVKVVARDGTLLDMNPAGLRMIEADSLEQARGRDMLDLVAPAHRPAYRNLLRRVMAGDGARLEFEIIGLKGARRWLETHAVPLRDPEGRVTHVLGITGDVTERKRAEEDLRRSESRYRSLVRSALYGIYRSTPEGKLLEANPALVTILGYESEADLLAVDWTAAVYEDPSERGRRIEEYRDADVIEGAEVRWKRRDGTPVTVRLSGRVLRDETGKLVEYEMMVEDVTARRALEDQLRQAQKMEAIGQLAGGIAHDFNNLLTAILGSADLLLLDVPSEDPRREDLVAIREAGERAAALTRQLLAFSRQQVLQPCVIDLNVIVAGMEKLLQRIIGEDVRLETVAAAEPARVNADPGQIEQVILNLVVNARDAMPEGGGLTITTAHVALDAAFPQRYPTTVPGRYVRLAVSDTGQGMDEATKRRIFEPFFTTKGPGKGTGLGLAMVYGIVKQSGGYIWVRSEPGRGATFDVYLPAVDEASASEAPDTGPTPRHEGHETILLVEDDAAVRALARRALDRYGYHVLEASNGREAVDVAYQSEEHIDLMLVDVIMPEMGGQRSAEHLLFSRPGTKVLYMSGYPGSAESQRDFAPGEFLQKPFTPDALVRKVRELLDEDTAP